jgi:signal transduction histidine kinase/BarA-like signal transduction histidine kinase
MLTDFVIVDDSQADRILVARSLRKRNFHGLTIREARTTSEALALVAERCPDCLITDVHLPDASGVDLLARLTETFSGMPCPVVVITGSGSEDTAVEVLQAGAHDYVNKERISEPVLWEAVRYAQTRFELRKELEELNAELRRKDQLKTEFVANATHELRTPLTAIVGLIAVLQDEPLTPRAEEIVTTIASCCDSLLLSVDDILDLTKIQAGEFVLYPGRFQPRQCLDLVAASLRPLAEDKGLRLEVEVPEEVPEVVGDARRTRQLVYNLASNALKFTRQGQVTLRLCPPTPEPGGYRLRFEVQDTGIGIAPAAQGRIFERHYQSGRPDLRSQGTGLGLAIVDSLTRRMGGTVGLISQLGVGSTFWFELPFGLPAQAVAIVSTEPRQELSPEDDERSLRLLIAEDNTIIAKVLARQLRGLGHQPTVTSDGSEAVAALTEQSFDAVLLDARMPRMDGLTAASEIRDRFSSQELPIILLTADAQIDAETWRSAGIDACLVKPVAPDVIGPVLRRLTSPQ